MIRILCLGKIKERYLTDMIDDYKSRIDKYHKIEIIEFKDTNDLEEEAQVIMKHIGPRDYVIACAIEGTSLDSVEFSRVIDKAFQESGTLIFVIGSSNGLSDSVKERANLLLSFSKMTIPHGLFRGVLLEQIYRAYKINNNETYHK